MKRLTDEEKFKQTVYLVEATHYEHHTFYEQNAVSGMYKYPFWTCSYEQDSAGLMETVGEVAGMPVTVSITWDLLNGKRVAYWEAMSQVVDFRMVKEWLDKKFPGVPRTNAMNFHQCVHFVMKD